MAISSVSAAKPAKDPSSSSDAMEPPSSDTVSAQPSLLQSLGGWFKESLGAKTGNSLKQALEDVLDDHIETTEHMVSDEERTLIRNMIAFGELTVSDVMVPRADVFAVDMTVSLEQLKLYVIEKRHTRIPIYNDTMDHIAGFVHAKDLTLFFAGDEEFDIKKVLRDILFVPPSMRGVDLLMQMRSSSCHIAIVVDEYGGTDGLVTMENVFEELVGDIQDEHDNEQKLELNWKGKNILIADARVEIDDLEEALGLSLTSDEEEEDFDTLGGLIFSEIGRVPAKGEVIGFLDDLLRFEILSADPRRIYRVKIRRNFTPLN